jgi:hypothetical protein
MFNGVGCYVGLQGADIDEMGGNVQLVGRYPAAR